MVFHKRFHSSRTIGSSIEAMACNFLKQQNLKIVEQNYRCRMGEIDIIAQDKETLVFVEVRYRKKNCFAQAEETVNYKKQKRIINTSLHFLVSHKLVEKVPCRFDVVGVNLIEGKIPELTWIKNAFEA